MRRDRDLNRWWCAGRGLTRAEWLLLAALFTSLLLLQGCGTTPSTSASPPLYAPAEVTAQVPKPIPLDATDPAPEDLLDNVAANGEQANELRRRLLAIQRWAKSIGAMR